MQCFLFCSYDFKFVVVLFFYLLLCNPNRCCDVHFRAAVQRSDSAEYCSPTKGLTFDLLDIEISLPHFVIENICVKCCHN